MSSRRCVNGFLPDFSGSSLGLPAEGFETIGSSIDDEVIAMPEPVAEQGHRVTPLELFFDLVFVFAVTQVTTFLSHDPTWGGLLRAMLLLAAVWWAWSAYAWLTNMLDPEEGGIRIAMFTATGAMLVASLAALNAFGRDALLFAVAYLIVRLVHLVLFTMAGRGDRDLFHAIVRTVPGSTIAPLLLVVAAFVDGWPQLALWGVALVILYFAPLIGRMRGFRVSPDHFVERFGLIMIIALGESIVAIGVGASGLPLDAGVIEAALLGFLVTVCLWWSYFDWSVYAAQGILAEHTGADRAALARDVYSYLHLPMVAGIVLFSFGVKTTQPHTDETLGILAAACLCGGIALYFLAHVVMRLRLGGGLGRGRPVAVVVLLALVPVATMVRSLVSVGLVAAACVALIAYEYLRHRTSRAWIRERRGSFTIEEARQVTEQDRLPRFRRRRGNDDGSLPAGATDVADAQDLPPS